jgi:phage terminase large subunit GpA-like protein
MVPTGTVMITGGVDVQRDGYYYTIRAWRDNMTSFNLFHDQCFSWREVERAMNRTFYDRDKNEYVVNLCCVDSGDQTDDVYDFCAINAEWAVPIKGASGRLQGRYQRTTIDRANSKANGLPLYRVDTNHYKDALFARMERDEDDGGWYIYDGCDPEYCDMVASEHKVLKRHGGRLASVWEPKASGRPNHYLDCEVYAMLAADLCGIRSVNA